MSGFSDCSGKIIPVFSEAKVVSCNAVDGAVPQDSVYSLVVEFCGGENSIPMAGQFFMLRSKKSQQLLARPISVYNVSRAASTNNNGSMPTGIERPLGIEGGVQIEFLILKKGSGTQELCALQEGEIVELLGPCGNAFPEPAAAEKVCIAGGGIGVAPVAGFASTLAENSYDFYASFKSGSYGLEHIKPATLVVTTDDGSCGVHGMISAALTTQVLKEKNYSVVYACGPEPMLRYIQQICGEAGVKCYLSMESRMACGMGVCLGCTIKTTGGLKRCCKDGPVFAGEEIIFEQHAATAKRQSVEKVDLSVVIKAGGIEKEIPKVTLRPRNEFGVTQASVRNDTSASAAKSLTLKNPVIAASGTFGFGTEYKTVFDVGLLGAICSKGLTLEPREGNSGIRVWETPSGLMNSIGLQNPGIPHFIENELPQMQKLGTAVIANLSGSTLESYCEGARLLERTSADAIELNISCPNVSHGGASWGMTCSTAASITKEIRKIVTKPLIVKLTPQADDVVAVAMGCVQAGADAISLCNSFQGVAIDIENARPVFDKIKAGFGGPAVRPIALRLIYEVAQAMNKLPQDQRVPIIGIGGVATWRDAVEFIMAGASAVQVGSATFANPLAMVEIVKGLEEFMKCKGYASVEEMRGLALR